MDKRQRGDWQTPDALAALVVARLQKPKSILEPTCGEGAFLSAACAAFPRAHALGFEIDRAHVKTASKRLGSKATITHADFFITDWRAVIDTLPEPILVVGNPPWVNASALERLGGQNVPKKTNAKALSGLAAITGLADFDVCEWMILRLLDALAGRQFCLAMLCKTAVCRRVLQEVERRDLCVKGEIRRIDAARHFDAAVDAALLVINDSAQPVLEWPVFDSLVATEPSASLAIEDGVLIADKHGYDATLALAGDCDPEWRSGVKHDCAAVMELRRDGAALYNGFGERVDVEARVLSPLMKCTDVARGLAPTRVMIVTQRSLQDDPRTLAESAPKAWRYLSKHRDKLAARRSRIYKDRPPFSIFGVGEYSFAPWKVAVSGLHKALDFRVVGPHETQPIVLDDTCYFLPFANEASARKAHAALSSERARRFFLARIFWDAKRPVQKRTLQALDLRALLKTRGRSAGTR